MTTKDDHLASKMPIKKPIHDSAPPSKSWARLQKKMVKKNKKPITHCSLAASSTHTHEGSSVGQVSSSNPLNNTMAMRNLFSQPINLDTCFLCDDHKPKKSTTLAKSKGQRKETIPSSVNEFWLEAPIKKKLQMLQMDCKFVLDQIRCSSPYTTKEGDKPAFLSKPSSCLCPACRKKKAIFNAVIAGM